MKSVLSQSYRNFELIVVDDGSTDRTSSILRRLAAGDERLRLVRTENRGPAEARNAALDLVSPDTNYISFIDADDELLPDALAYAAEGAKEGTDMVLFGFTIVEADGKEREYCERDELIGPPDLKEAFPRLYKANLLNQVWAKLYAAPLILQNRIRFKNYLWGEDRLFVFDALEHSRKIAVLGECRYRYIMHAGESLISRFYPQKFAVCLEADRRAQEMCTRYGVQDDPDLRYMFTKSVFSCVTMLFSPSCRLSEEGKILYVRTIQENPRVQQRCRDTSGGAHVKFLCHVLRKGSEKEVLRTFRAVSFVGDAAPDLFLRLKHRK